MGLCGWKKVYNAFRNKTKGYGHKCKIVNKQACILQTCKGVYSPKSSPSLLLTSPSSISSFAAFIFSATGYTFNDQGHRAKTSYVDREAGLAQGIRGTFFEHPLLVYNLGGLRPLGKHYQCYSGTVWCAVQRTPSSLLLLDTHPVGSLSFEGGTLDTQHHFSAPIAYNLICYTSFATTTYQHRTSV